MCPCSLPKAPQKPPRLLPECFSSQASTLDTLKFTLPASHKWPMVRYFLHWGSLMPPWCLPGASLVHPWCIPAPLDLVPGPLVDTQKSSTVLTLIHYVPLHPPRAPQKPPRLLHECSSSQFATQDPSEVPLSCCTQVEYLVPPHTP